MPDSPTQAAAANTDGSGGGGGRFVGSGDGGDIVDGGYRRLSMAAGAALTAAWPMIWTVAGIDTACD